MKLRTRKQLAVLIYLVLEGSGRAVSRDALAELLWPDVDMDHARHSLAQSLSAIRNVMGRDAVVSSGEMLSLKGEITTDINDFSARSSTASVAAPLSHTDSWAGSQYALWVESARRTCVKRAIQSLSQLVAESTAAGNLQNAMDYATKLYELDRYSITAVRLLAEKLVLEDDWSGAIALLRAFIRRVEDELGCDPPAEIARSLQGIQAGVVHGCSYIKADVGSHDRRELTSAFVGRDSELAELDRIWFELAERSPQKCLITGPAGIGKTTLLRRFSTKLAARGAYRIALSCQEIGREIPFSAVSDLIAKVAADPRISGTDPAWLSEASRISPGLAVRYTGVPSPPIIPATAIPVRVADAIANIIEAVVENQHVALLIDDVHFVDSASRSILHLLFRRLTVPVLCVGTARVLSHLESLATSRSAPQLDWDQVTGLAPLSHEQVLELLDGASAKQDVQDVAGTILRLSDGNPYFVAMLLADWKTHVEHTTASHGRWEPSIAAWDPPSTLRTAFTKMSARISVVERDLLSALAIARRGLTFEVLEAALAIDSTDLQRAIRSCIDMGVLRLVGGESCFRNELHRAHFYYSLPQDRKRYFHFRVARALQSSASQEDSARQLEIGQHLLSSALFDEGGSRILAAAEDITIHGAPREAELALRAIPDDVAAGDARYGIALARSLIAQGKYKPAYDRLCAAELEGLAPVERAGVLVLQAECAQRGFLENLDTRRTVAEQALREARTVADDDLMLNALQLSAEIAAEAADLGRIRDFVAFTEDIAATANCRTTQALAHVSRGYCSMILGSFNAAAGAFAQSVGIFTSMRSDAYNKRPLNGLGMALTSSGRTAEAICAFRKAIEIAERSGDTFVVPNIRSNLGALYADRGHFADAARCFERALWEAQHAGHPRVIATVYGLAASLALDIGATEQADRILRSAERTAADWSNQHAYLDLATVRADFYLVIQEPESAWAIVEELQAKRPRYILGEAARQERLVRQYVHATEGVDAYLAYTRSRCNDLETVQLAPRLEMDILDTLIDGKNHPRSLDTVQQQGLVGVMAHLAAMRYLPAGVSYQAGESPAMLAGRLFPQHVAGPIPQALDWSPEDS